MILDIDEEKRQLLADLVASRIAELHPTIRRCQVYSASESLKRDLTVLQEVFEQLKSPAPHSVQ
ncbi:MAG: hypothetical protein ACYC6N_30835 [Pirellulaceae bacterium]